MYYSKKKETLTKRSELREFKKMQKKDPDKLAERLSKLSIKELLSYFDEDVDGKNANFYLLFKEVCLTTSQNPNANQYRGTLTTNILEAVKEKRGLVPSTLPRLFQKVVRHRLPLYVYYKGIVLSDRDKHIKEMGRKGEIDSDEQLLPLSDGSMLDDEEGSPKDDDTPGAKIQLKH